MKVAKVVSLVLFGIVSQEIGASNYPDSYVHQTAYVVHKGPVLLATVSSGMMSQTLIGYKNSGVLAESHPGSIQAVIITECVLGDGSYVSRKIEKDLGGELHGSGYMSSPFSMRDLMPQACPYTVEPNIQIAFTDGVRWDSMFGANYRFYQSEPYRAGGPSLQTHESGRWNSEINQKAYDFIIDQMRR